jgi:hypothetical protein
MRVSMSFDLHPNGPDYLSCNPGITTPELAEEQVPHFHPKYREVPPK